MLAVIVTSIQAVIRVRTLVKSMASSAMKTEHHDELLGDIMKAAFNVLLVCVAALAGLCQPTGSKYEVASITAVNTHAGGGENTTSSAASYDISVKVGNMLYVVLYTPPAGTYGVQQAAGHDLLVSVGTNTITFNDLLGRTSEVPILRRETLPPENDFDLARAPGRYYNVKYENLSRRLTLTPGQQIQLKPILQQEAGELREIYANPALSFEARVRRFEKIVSASDQKLKTFLTAQQWQILQNLRADQKQELRKLVAARKGQ